MKSEHRHDLQTNDLGKLMVQAEPFVEKYGAKILGGIGALIVLLIVLIIWNSQKTSAQSEAWTRLAAAGSTEDFENVAEDYAGKLKIAKLNIDQNSTKKKRKSTVPFRCSVFFLQINFFFKFCWLFDKIVRLDRRTLHTKFVSIPISRSRGQSN